jgi:hypothetical protein
MKSNTIPKQALILLITGLLMTTLLPAIGRYLVVPDLVKGFLTGLGLAIEFIALVKIQRSKSNKSAICS